MLQDISRNLIYTEIYNIALCQILRCTKLRKNKNFEIHSLSIVLQQLYVKADDLFNNMHTLQTKYGL